MSKINTIHTPCKNCVFATYDNITQVGCALNYINKYKAKDVEILEAYDNELEFYIVNNKKCIGYRENSWFRKLGLDNASLEEKIELYNKHNHLPYLMVVNLQDYSYGALDALEKDISSIKIKPQKIIFIRYPNTEYLYTIERIQEFISNINTSCKWRMQTMVENTPYQQVLHNVININKKYRFIFSTKSYNESISDIVMAGDKIVYSDLDRFTIISDSDKNNLLFSAPSYRYGIVSEKKDIFENNENYIFL